MLRTCAAPRQSAIILRCETTKCARRTSGEHETCTRRTWSAGSRRERHCVGWRCRSPRSAPARCEGRASGADAVVRPGISVLLTDSIAPDPRTSASGCITNQTGVDEHGESDIERLRDPEARAAGVQLVRLFSPEHGIRGTEDRENLASGIDERSGLVDPFAVHERDDRAARQHAARPRRARRGSAGHRHADVDVRRRDAVLDARGGAARYPDRRARPAEPAQRRAAGRPDARQRARQSRGADPDAPGSGVRALSRCRCVTALTMGELARYFNAELQHRRAAARRARCRVAARDVVRRDRAAVGAAVAEPADARQRHGLSGARRLRGTNLSVGRGTTGRLPARSARPGFRADARRRRCSTRAACRACGSSAATSRPAGRPTASTPGRTIPGVRIVVTDRDRFSPGRTGAALLWAIHRAAPDSLVVRGPAFDDRFGRPAMREAHACAARTPTRSSRATARRSSAWWRTVARYQLYR